MVTQILRACISRFVAALGGPWRELARRVVPLLPRRRVVLRVRGRRMAADSPDRIAALLLWKAGWLEHAEEMLLTRELKPGMTAVDIGANIGFHTLLMARAVGPAGRVLAFEPDPENFELLRQNVAINGCKNIECVGKAVSDRAGRLRLYRSEEHHGDHRTFDSKDNRPSLPIESVRLDDFFSPPATVDFIKMDIQGSEMAAMKGMRTLLERSKDARILCEFSPDLLRLGGCAPQEFLDFWTSAGFRIYALDDAGGLSLQPDAQSVIQRCPEPGHLNLFISRR